MDQDCPVCYSGFVDPVSLSCGHVLCFPCLRETRSSTANTSHLCPHSLCVYRRASPVFLSGCPAMTPEQLEMWGPRRIIENVDSPRVTPPSSPRVTPPPSPRVTPPPSPHVTPPPSSPVSLQTSPTLSPRMLPPSSSVGSPRRSTRRGVPNRRFLGFEIPSRRGDGEGQAQREVRGRGSTGLSRVLERSYVEESSSDEDQREEVVSQQLRQESNLPVRTSRRYFKSYTLITDCEKTHDTVILQTYLENMTANQIRLNRVNKLQISRDIREIYPTSFPSHPIKDISKLVKRCVLKLVSDYKKKLASVGGSGQTGPPNTSDENIISQILSLDDSIRINGGSAVRALNLDPLPEIVDPSISSQASGGGETERILTPGERQQVVADLNLDTPITVNRRRLNQDHGRDLRESSLAAHARRPRQGHPRLESSFNSLVEMATSSRTAAHEVSSTLNTTTEDRQWYKERKMEEDRRQRELDREAAKEEKQRDREEKQRDREDRMQANLLMAGVISRILPGAAENIPGLGGNHQETSGNLKRQVEVQYHPEEGSQPFPVVLTLSTLSVLLSDLKDYTGVQDASGIVWVDSATGRPVLITHLDQVEFSLETLKVKIVQKVGKKYIKMS